MQKSDERQDADLDNSSTPQTAANTASECVAPSNSLIIASGIVGLGMSYLTAKHFGTFSIIMVKHSMRHSPQHRRNGHISNNSLMPFFVYQSNKRMHKRSSLGNVPYDVLGFN
jgi:hypothetical protein